MYLTRFVLFSKRFTFGVCYDAVLHETVAIIFTVVHFTRSLCSNKLKSVVTCLRLSSY